MVMKPYTKVALFQFICLPAHFWSWVWAKILRINLVVTEETDMVTTTKAVPRELTERLQIPEGQTEVPDLYPIACPKCDAKFFMGINREEE